MTTQTDTDFFANLATNGKPTPATPETAPRGVEVLRERLKATDLIAPRVIPSSKGWRNWLYRVSGQRINAGESPDERRVRDLRDAVGTHLRDTYSIVCLGGKGGVGKTAITALLGSTFASIRKDQVVAVDLDPAQAANLAARVDRSASSLRDISGGEFGRYSHLRALTGQNDVGLEVAASPRNAGTDCPALSTEEYTAGHTQLSKYYGLILTDCGTDLEHPAMAGVLQRADAVVMIASAVPDGAEGASSNLEWLRDHGYGDLLSRLLLIVNHIRPAAGRKDRKATARLVDALQEHFGQWVPAQRTIVMPWDQHIASAGVVDIEQLHPVTRRRVLEAAAALASGFTAT